MKPDAAALLAALRAVLAARGPLALAVSGGVDSMTLAAVACAGAPDTEVFHAVSPAVPELATERVHAYAARFGWRLRVIDAGEMRDPDYRANPGNRCYYCKRNLYAAVQAHTALPVASGANLDDLGDYRPGLEAAREHRVVHPLVEAGIDKAGVRAIAAHLGLAGLSELAASPCLASRVTTGIAIDADLLPLIDRAEAALRAALAPAGEALDLRCRVRPSGLAVELGGDAQAVDAALVRATVRAVFAGTRFARHAEAIGIESYRRGSAFIRVGA